MYNIIISNNAWRSLCCILSTEIIFISNGERLRVKSHINNINMRFGNKIVLYKMLCSTRFTSVLGTNIVVKGYGDWI